MKVLTASQVLLIETYTQTKIADVLDWLAERSDGDDYACEIAHAMTAVPEYESTEAWQTVKSQFESFERGVLHSAWGFQYRMGGLDETNTGPIEDELDAWLDLQTARNNRAARLIWLAAFHEDMLQEFATLERLVPPYCGGAYEEEDGWMNEYRRLIDNLKVVRSTLPELFI
jgi:hypothetical protein